LGLPLAPREPTEAEAERVRVADRALAQDPEDLDLLVEAALAREAVWRYNEAVELYTRGMRIDTGDYRLYLGRAHRLIRLRQFELAATDLDRSVQLDPYGFNSAYLRGLVLYLLGRFSEAADEYGRCMSLAGDEHALALAAEGRVPGDPRYCMVIAADGRSRVAIESWRYRALARAGRHEEAAELLQGVAQDLSLTDEPAIDYSVSTILPGTNEHYYNLLLFYSGLRTESEMLDRERWGAQWPTVAYGVAVWHMVAGNDERAVELLREVVAEPYWARLGHVAAETDLARLGEELN
jgi:tetratricopeptide (TPR) repeat protein